jgi:hypothetical protein
VYKIDKTDLGFYLTFAGDMTKAEIEKWYAESEEVLTGQQAPFGVIIDMRTLAPLPVEAQEVMVRGQAMYRSHGMQRSCVILDDAITTIQFMRLARLSESLSSSGTSMLRRIEIGLQKHEIGSGTLSLPRKQQQLSRAWT